MSSPDRVVFQEKASDRTPMLTRYSFRPNPELLREVSTSQDGAFRDPLLSYGNYEVNVQKSGFAKYKQGPITLQLNQAADLKVDLQVAGTVETVTVGEDAPLINTTNAEIGVNFDTKRIAELPLSTNRNLVNLAGSVPGVSQISNGD